MITTTIVSLRVALTLLALAIVAAMLSASCGGSALAPTPYTVASRCAVDPHACATPPKCVSVLSPPNHPIGFKVVCEGDPEYPTGGGSHEGQ